MKYEIILETQDLIAINKPGGLLSIPDRFGVDISLKDMLIDKYGSIYTVHRLDRETSGLIVFAKNEVEHKFLSKAFEARDVEKYYQGIVAGVPFEKSKTIDEPIMEHPVKKGLMIINRKGKASVTDYEVLDAFGKFSLLKFRIHTGRTHQIRVHMGHEGHPVLCDSLYGDGQPILLSSFKKRYNLSKSEFEERPILSRLALHAWQLKFKDSKGTLHSLEAPLPKDMRALLQQAGKVLR